MAGRHSLCNIEKKRNGGFRWLSRVSGIEKYSPKTQHVPSFLSDLSLEKHDHTVKTLLSNKQDKTVDTVHQDAVHFEITQIGVPMPRTRVPLLHMSNVLQGHRGLLAESHTR